jgi:hypothetical protein
MKSVIAALLAALAVACTAPLSGAPCPCLPGFTCDVELDICRPSGSGSGAAEDGGGGDSGPGKDAASQDAGPGGESDASCSEPECGADAGCGECAPTDGGCDCEPSDAGPPIDAGPGDAGGIDAGVEMTAHPH